MAMSITKAETFEMFQWLHMQLTDAGYVTGGVRWDSYDDYVRVTLMGEGEVRISGKHIHEVYPNGSLPERAYRCEGCKALWRDDVLLSKWRHIHIDGSHHDYCSEDCCDKHEGTGKQRSACPQCQSAMSLQGVDPHRYHWCRHCNLTWSTAELAECKQTLGGGSGSAGAAKGNPAETAPPGSGSGSVEPAQPESARPVLQTRSGPTVHETACNTCSRDLTYGCAVYGIGDGKGACGDCVGTAHWNIDLDTRIAAARVVERMPWDWDPSDAEYEL